jgi:glutamate racemase
MNVMDDNERPIAFCDSGIGGLPYLASARIELPGERFVYLADREGFPYGTKPRDEVRDRVLAVVRTIVDEYKPKALVIACNTASQAALASVREAFPDLPVVGTVPAIKPAAEQTKTGVIGVMATEGAVEDPYLDELIAQHAKGVTVLREAAQELVEFVEHRTAVADFDERRRVVEPFVRRLVDGGADRIVLACTHFLHLRDEIALCAGERAKTVDSRLGVAKRLAELLESRGLRSSASHVNGKSVFLITGRPPFEERYSDFARRFGLEGPRPLSDNFVV